jgi:hypothetical protein
MFEELERIMSNKEIVFPTAYNDVILKNPFLKPIIKPFFEFTINDPDNKIYFGGYKSNNDRKVHGKSLYRFRKFKNGEPESIRQYLSKLHNITFNEIKEKQDRFDAMVYGMFYSSVFGIPVK